MEHCKSLWQLSYLVVIVLPTSHREGQETCHLFLWIRVLLLVQQSLLSFIRLARLTPRPGRVGSTRTALCTSVVHKSFVPRRVPRTHVTGIWWICRTA